jgi:flavin reductase (DIM6/NTAB) family NADH-FMN oxidoreductase RutF
VCVARALNAHAAIEESGAFGVNILGVHQLEVGLRFAGLRSTHSDRFDGLSCVSGVTGSPLLVDSIASFDCRLHATHPGGDHSIFVGEVVQALISGDEAPLLYHQRLWHRPEALPALDALDDLTGL